MTIDPRPHRPAPRLNLSGREWKLYLLGGLGLAYAATLTGVATQARSDAVQQPESPTSQNVAPVGLTASSATAAVWLDQVPIADRPGLTLPAGWTLAATNVQTSGRGATPASVPSSATSSSPAPAATTRISSQAVPAQTVARMPRVLTRTS